MVKITYVSSDEIFNFLKTLKKRTNLTTSNGDDIMYMLTRFRYKEIDTTNGIFFASIDNYTVRYIEIDTLACAYFGTNIYEVVSNHDFILHCESISPKNSLQD